MVVDVYSRRVVGWCMGAELVTRLMLDALNMALEQRGARGVIHHSDRGSQYTSIAFGNRCRDAGVRLSMGYSSIGYLSPAEFERRGGGWDHMREAA